MAIFYIAMSQITRGYTKTCVGLPIWPYGPFFNERRASWDSEGSFLSRKVDVAEAISRWHESSSPFQSQCWWDAWVAWASRWCLAIHLLYGTCVCPKTGYIPKPNILRYILVLRRIVWWRSIQSWAEQDYTHIRFWGNVFSDKPTNLFCR